MAIVDEDETYFLSDEGREAEEPSTFRFQEPLLPSITDDIVVTHIWPKLLRFVRTVELRNYRSLSIAWRDLVSTSDHWTALKRLLAANQPCKEWLEDGWDLEDMMWLLIEVVKLHRLEETGSTGISTIDNVKSSLSGHCVKFDCRCSAGFHANGTCGLFL